MKHIRDRLAIVFVTMLLAGNTFSSSALAGENERQRIILEMFEVMQYGKLIDQMSVVVGQQITAEVKKKYPNISPELITRIESITGEEFSKIKPDMMIFLGVFLTNNFTEPELVQLLEFHKSSIGQKSLAVMPKMMQEMSAWMPTMTQKFGRQTMARVKAMLQEKGYDL